MCKSLKDSLAKLIRKAKSDFIDLRIGSKNGKTYAISQVSKALGLKM